VRAGATRRGFVPSMREVRLVEPHLPGCLTESFRSPSRFWGRGGGERKTTTPAGRPTESIAVHRGGMSDTTACTVHRCGRSVQSIVQLIDAHVERVQVHD
jgi:hypothetical protein